MRDDHIPGAGPDVRATDNDTKRIVTKERVPSSRATDGPLIGVVDSGDAVAQRDRVCVSAAFERVEGELQRCAAIPHRLVDLRST